MLILLKNKTEEHRIGFALSATSFKEARVNFEVFDLERIQSIWENRVAYNLTESGVHPFTLSELLPPEERDRLMNTRLGYGQTNGLEELRTAVARIYSDLNMDNVLITNGSAEANFLSVWTLLEPGDEILLMLPNYMQIWGIARSFGITVKPFYLREENDWGPDMDEVRRLVCSRTRMIAVCNPNNPTGAVLSREHMAALVSLAESCGAWLYADEVYRGAELEGEETPSFIALYDKALVCAGLSKAYALPGLRIGWLAGPEKTIARLWAAHDYTSITSGILSNHIAALVLEPEKRQAVLQRTKDLLKRNLTVLQEWIARRSDFLSLIPPKAGGMAFIRYALDINSTELTERLRREKSVFVIAGDCFGMDHFIRIGIGAETDYLETGLNMTGEFLDDISRKIPQSSR